jgi:ABC-type transport system involved in multi-copper enzyme maturation permease subunit
MRALVQAEVLKLRTRSAAWMLLATLAVVTLGIAATIPKAGDHDAPVPLNDPAVLATTVAGLVPVSMVFVVLLGVLSFTQEFRYGTATSTYLVEPRRSRVLSAKLLSQVLASVVVTVVTLAYAGLLAVAIIRFRDGDATIGAQFWQTTAAAFVCMATYSVIGVSIGVLIRNQVVAAVGVLVWMMAVEWTVLPSFPTVGRWLPVGVTNTLLQQGPSLGLDGKLLSVPVSGLVLLGYTALAVTLAVRLTPRRDIL